jgi:hypothetical protein
MRREIALSARLKRSAPRYRCLVRQDKAGRMAQHVWMHLKADLGRDASALDQLGQAGDGERCTPL